MLLHHGHVMADGTAGQRPHRGVTASDLSGDAADDRAAKAAGFSDPSGSEGGDGEDG